MFLKNLLTFASDYYLQSLGTAIDTKFVPMHSDLTGRCQEQKVYSIIENRIGLNTKEYFIENRRWFSYDNETLLNSKSLDAQEVLEI